MKKRYIYIVSLLLMLLIWELVGNSSNTVKLLASTPSASFLYLVSNFSSIIEATWFTFAESFLGLFLATLFSFLVMIIGLYFKKFLDLIMPVMIISQVVPIITLAPLIILVFGLGIKAKVIISALMCFFPIFVNFNNGIRNISSDIIDLLRVYNATMTFKIRYIYFPLSTPNILTGLKISSVLSVIGAIVGEFNGADIGLGKNLFLAARRLEPELMITSLLFSSIIGLSLYGSIIIIEFIIGRWYKNSIS